MLVGVAIMFLIAGQIAEDRLDDRVDDVTKEFDASLNRFREDVRKELDARRRAGRRRPVTPTPTPFPTPPPETTPTPEGDGTADPDARRRPRLTIRSPTGVDPGRRDPAP